MAKKNNSRMKRTIGIGAGVAAIAAAAAGAYFLYGKNGSKNRKKIKSWTLKAKAEVMDRMEKLKNLSKKTYHEVVDTVASKYKAVKTIDPKEVEQMAKELKSHWKNIKKHLTETPKKKGEK